MNFIKNELKMVFKVDLFSLRTRVFLGMANLLPDFYLFRLVKAVLLRSAGVRCGLFTNYIRSPLYMDKASSLSIGHSVFINKFLCIEGTGRVEIGNDCQIGPRCTFVTTNHSNGLDEIKPIKIGNNVWIGAGSILLPGATISDNIVVAAGSVVRGTLDAGSLWGGVPAKHIR